MAKHLSPFAFTVIFIAMVLVLTALIIISRQFTAGQVADPTPVIEEPAVTIPNPTTNEDTTTTVDVYEPTDPPQLVLFRSPPLAGAQSFLFRLNDQDYQVALNTNKLIILYFTSNDCGSCNTELSTLKNVLTNLAHDDVVGFVVHLSDQEETNLDLLLADQFAAHQPQTKIFLRNNVRVIKSAESWSANRYLEEINDIIPN